MDQQGKAWSAIFILIVLFALYNTLNTTDMISAAEIELQAQQGWGLNEHIQRTTLQTPPQGELYEAFTIKETEAGSTLRISIDNDWLDKKAIASNTIQLQKKQGETYNEVQAEKITYNEETIITLQEPQTGTYAITGTAGTISKQKEQGIGIGIQLIILITSIGTILFINYHKKHIKEHKKYGDPNTVMLEGYIRKAILDGNKEEQIKQVLKSVGWQEQQIDQTLRRIRFF